MDPLQRGSFGLSRHSIETHSHLHRVLDARDLLFGYRDFRDQSIETGDFKEVVTCRQRSALGSLQVACHNDTVDWRANLQVTLSIFKQLNLALEVRRLE